MSDSVLVNYKAVLGDLEDKKASLAAQIAQYDSLIQGIKKVMPNSAPHESAGVLSFAPPFDTFKHMSMRWAILQFLTEFSQDPCPTSDVALALLNGGFQNSTNFNSKVSAILSQMVGKNEVVKDGQDWEVSAHGREMWRTIKESERYLNRHIATVEEAE